MTTTSTVREPRFPTHHHTGHQVGGTWQPAKPLRFRGWLGWWHQWRAEVQCARTLGHCWHLEHGHWIDWYCCACGGEVDGCPPKECRACDAVHKVLPPRPAITPAAWLAGERQ